MFENDYRWPQEQRQLKHLKHWRNARRTIGELPSSLDNGAGCRMMAPVVVRPVAFEWWFKIDLKVKRFILARSFLPRRSTKSIEKQTLAPSFVKMFWSLEHLWWLTRKKEVSDLAKGSCFANSFANSCNIRGGHNVEHLVGGTVIQDWTVQPMEYW